jgi:peptidoglycan-associated lipoprotein
MEALSRGLAVITPPGAALQDVYYEFDSIDLKADAEAILKKNAEWMKANPSARVEVEGHCDDVGSAEYNLALGAKRARSTGYNQLRQRSAGMFGAERRLSG